MKIKNSTKLHKEMDALVKNSVSSTGATISSIAHEITVTFSNGSTGSLTLSGDDTSVQYPSEPLVGGSEDNHVSAPKIDASTILADCNELSAMLEKVKNYRSDDEDLFTNLAGVLNEIEVFIPGICVDVAPPDDPLSAPEIDQAAVSIKCDIVDIIGGGIGMGDLISEKDIIDMKLAFADMFGPNTPSINGTYRDECRIRCRRIMDSITEHMYGVKLRRMLSTIIAYASCHGGISPKCAAKLSQSSPELFDICLILASESGRVGVAILTSKLEKLIMEMRMRAMHSSHH